MSKWVAMLRVGVREMTVMADIGVYSREIGRRQPLVVTAWLWIDRVGHDAIEATIDYRDIAAVAATLDAHHIALVETFAHCMVSACLKLSGVRRASVTTDRPQALPSGIATVTTVLSRTAVLSGVAASASRSMRDDA
ncbi:dihydroneopterin aldolase [Sphingomonas arantia]|uniref:Dihydroneopterin aldolase n=1 Tax=Sphingomonas arantia TaxID=1460676 RepID=A0ABW4TVX1_9SPHN